MLQLKDTQEERILLYSMSFSPTQDLAHPHWEWQSALLSLLLQMLISSRVPLTDTCRVIFSWIRGHPVVQLSWHIKLTIIRSLWTILWQRSRTLSLPYSENMKVFQLSLQYEGHLSVTILTNWHRGKKNHQINCCISGSKDCTDTIF